MVSREKPDLGGLTIPAIIILLTSIVCLSAAQEGENPEKVMGQMGDK